MATISAAVSPFASIRTSRTTSNPYEHFLGYSRAIRRGPFIFVSGTTSINPSQSNPTKLEVLHPESAYLQTITAFKEAIKAIEALGGNKRDVVRVRMFVRDKKDVEEVGRGMKYVFQADEDEGEKYEWAATMISGVAFVEEEIKVEVEVDALIL